MTAPGTMGEWWIVRETERARRHAAACRDACEGQDQPSDLWVPVNEEIMRDDPQPINVPILIVLFGAAFTIAGAVIALLNWVFL